MRKEQEWDLSFADSAPPPPKKNTYSSQSCSLAQLSQAHLQEAEFELEQPEF